jgi:hypothetical protein
LNIATDVQVLVTAKTNSWTAALLNSSRRLAADNYLAAVVGKAVNHHNGAELAKANY